MITNKLLETIVLNDSGKKITQGVKRMARRRKTTSKKVVYRTQKTKLLPGILYAGGGLILSGLLTKAIPTSRPWLVPAAATAITAIFAGKYLGKNALPVTLGMGAAAVTALVSSTPQLSGLLSDFQPRPQFAGPQQVRVVR